MGKIEAIYLRRQKGVDPEQVVAMAQAGEGLLGDHFSKAGGKRQITLLSLEDWKEVCQIVGPIDPKKRRANLLISGLDLKESVGRTIRVGTVDIYIEGETTPCRLMDETRDGLKNALSPDWRGGVYGRVLCGGLILVGSDISFI